MASVTYKHVTKRFGDVVAVADLTLEIADKEFLVLVGPSGCGKSTSLRLLAGLEEVTEGEIYIGDRLVNDVPSKDRDIAMVFQSYALYPHMSVFDNMAFALKLRKVKKPEIKERVQQSAEALGIAGLLDRKPKQLSGGQRQRVALGRAIVREPAVFLMDEPLSNLDAKLRVEARAMLSRLHLSLGTTFIYVTHDQVEAMTMGTRIAVQKDGVLQQVDTPQNLYDLPANIFVAGFIGSPAMNFFDARLAGRDDAVSIQTKAFQVEVPKDKATGLNEHLGKDVIFGIRPEDIHDKRFTPIDVTAAPLVAKVDVIEPMGSERYLYLVVDGKDFVARVDPRSTASVGEDLEIALNMDNLHVFDAKTEKAIL
ncbi:MAG: sn-glycerol-3-phosphate ABC transporter ATP-binding protein UgpC [Anaerolineae bacterium]|nr:sn-glycerol-3-phosphate ABC transporter ATP-binding protein UgpC [Anaerolineae bacterium]NIN93775.1 sn-glycerol-3-phosphate ABC transporter ATP-binding protein UgpC [Anaerolineae bacterium]NIQ76810.1 sn-glycerol-3-phosphate ABC transporter ATP-binding protein UgpC [Anaerolineae bacterium]